MSKNLNLKVNEDIFYRFHTLKGNLKAGTNQTCLEKLLIIAEEKLDQFDTKTERDEYLKHLEEKEYLVSPN